MRDVLLGLILAAIICLIVAVGIGTERITHKIETTPVIIKGARFDVMCGPGCIITLPGEGG